MRGQKRAEVFGSEEQKQREEHEVRSTAVLDPEENGQDQAVEAVDEILPSADGRPPKPSEDAVECPNWEKGRLRSKPWLRCQGWALNGFGTCKNCHKFSQEAPIYRSVSRNTLMLVLGNAKRALEGVYDSFKDTGQFKTAWSEFVSITNSVTDERGRDFSPLMRRVEVLVLKTFAEEVSYLFGKCQSFFRTNEEIKVTLDGRRVTVTHEDVKSSVRNWKKEIDKEERRAEINGEFPRWIFAGELRYLCSAIGLEIRC